MTIALTLYTTHKTNALSSYTACMLLTTVHITLGDGTPVTEHGMTAGLPLLT